MNDHQRERLAFFQDLAKGHGGQCLSPKYVNADTKLTFRCEVGHEWTCLPGYLRGGRWCGRCSIETASSIAREEGLERLRAKARAQGGECLSPEYGGTNVHHVWKCAEGHEWKAIPASILRGTWCRLCAKGNRLDLEELHRMAAARGGKCLATEYNGVHGRVPWQCAEGHGWDQEPQKLRYHKTWCPTCARRSTMTLADLQALAAKSGGTCLSTRVTNMRGAYRWRCAAGHVFSMSGKDVARGHFCPRCRARGHDDLSRMKRLARRRGGKCISTEYVNATTKLEWRCREGHTWCTVPGAIIQGSWCWTCMHSTSSTTPLTLEDLHETAAKHGGRCLATQFVNSTTRVLWACALEHQWTARIANVRQGSWCPKCAHRFPGTIDGMHALAARWGGRCLSTEYNGHRTIVSFVCASGHRFKATGTAAKSGVWCGECQ